MTDSERLGIVDDLKKIVVQCQDLGKMPLETPTQRLRIRCVAMRAREVAARILRLYEEDNKNAGQRKT